jgi:hypothetical protein
LKTTALKDVEPRRLTTLWAPTACYRDNFASFTFAVKIHSSKNENNGTLFYAGSMDVSTEKGDILG